MCAKIESQVGYFFDTDDCFRIIPGICISLAELKHNKKLDMGVTGRYFGTLRSAVYRFHKIGHIDLDGGYHNLRP